MMDWKEVISELNRLGCLVTIQGENLHVKWQGKGNPPSKEKFSSLVQTLKVHKEEILDNPYFLIEQTLKDINQIWQPGFLNYLKFSKPNEWEKILKLEQRMNQYVFKGDLSGLKKSLKEYEELIKGIIKGLEITDKQRELFFQQNACRQ